jgi:hypothetical protein
MLAFRSSFVNSSEILRFISIVFAAWLFGTLPCFAASNENVAVRHIGHLNSTIVLKVLSQVHIVPFSFEHDSPILLQGKTMLRLHHKQKHELKATYRAGYSIVLLDATMQQIKALHEVIGASVTYRSKETGVVLAYTLRQENHIPTATLLTKVDHSPLQTPSGDPDATGLADEELALSGATERIVSELRHIPKISVSQPRDPNGQVDWLSAPVLTHTFAISSPQGIYNTEINVYALYRCLDGTDHYAATAAADWTATNAKWQGATSEGPNPTMSLDINGNLQIAWQDNRTYCSSPGFGRFFEDVCRYINYPLSYELTMVPRTEATVTQLNAAPAATQGEQTSYTSGFSFSIGGTVNVSAMGPGGGISAGATWTNTTQTTVPPLIVEVSNTANEGVDWNFKYCTKGLEPDSGTDCTSHVQMVKDVCQAQLGDDSGTDPQQGQTPVGKFSNAIQSAHWQTSTRVGNSFDIEVDFVAHTANTIAHLNNGDSGGIPDPVQGCNHYGCACVSVTTPEPVSKSITFEIPFPSTKCK